MEYNTLRGLRVEFENETYMPGDTFAFTVIVCGKDDFLSFGSGSQGLNCVLLRFQLNVLRVPVVIDTDSI
jgi:hypothetical protein